MVLTKGQKIKVVDNNELKDGTLRDVYETLDIAIVDIGDGVYKKVRIDQIAIVEEKPTEPVAKSEITITPSEFMTITCKIVAKLALDVDDSVKFMGACSILLGKIHTALFIEGSENE